MRRLIWAFTGRLYHIVGNIMSWLICVQHHANVSKKTTLLDGVDFPGSPKWRWVWRGLYQPVHEVMNDISNVKFHLTTRSGNVNISMWTCINANQMVKLKDVDVAFLTTLPPHCVTNSSNKTNCTLEPQEVTPLRIKYRCLHTRIMWTYNPIARNSIYFTTFINWWGQRAK